MPIATVGTPFSMRDTVSGEQVARSATCATLRLRRGQHIFNLGHVIRPDAKIENVEALCETVKNTKK